MTNLLPKFFTTAMFLLVVASSTMAQQPGYYIHNGTIISVPQATMGVQPQPGYTPQFQGVAPAAGFNSNQYGPPIPVQPQYATQPPAYPSVMNPGQQPLMVPGSNAYQGAPNSMTPQRNQPQYEPQRNTTSIYYGSTANLRPDPKPGTSNNSHQQATAKNSHRSPAESVKQVPEATQFQRGIKVDPQTGTITRQNVSASSMAADQPAGVSTQPSQPTQESLTRQRQERERQLAQQLNAQYQLLPSDPSSAPYFRHQHVIRQDDASKYRYNNPRDGMSGRHQTPVSTGPFNTVVQSRGNFILPRTADLNQTNQSSIGRLDPRSLFRR